MIQFRRGKTASWRKTDTVLSAGQPGYDKDKHKIKIGDGEKLWAELPYASGLSAEEVFNSETKAKERFKLDKEDKTIITYGTESPDDNTVGQLYLQYYDAEPEVDYIVETGISNGWTYRKWQSGIASCFCTFEFTTAIQTAIDTSSLYSNSSFMTNLQYPFTFSKVPCEVATVQSPGGLIWLATAKNGSNTKATSAAYCLISPTTLNNAVYKLSIQVNGFWK